MNKVLISKDAMMLSPLGGVLAPIDSANVKEFGFVFQDVLNLNKVT